MKKKRGVSPVIATVLLVAMVIVIALIIFLWFKGIGGETVTKFGKNVELVCGDVQFSSEYTNNKLFISNTGNIPIFGMKVKVEGGGSHTTYDMKTDLDSTWPDLGLNQGGTFSSGNISSHVKSDTEIITLTPILMGTSDKGEKTYLCNEKQYGYEITIY